jgi:hypothetical protein
MFDTPKVASFAANMCRTDQDPRRKPQRSDVVIGVDNLATDK